MTAADAVVVGSGPNGLVAAIVLAQAGLAVTVLEEAEELGGGLRSGALTLPGYLHDICSAVHTMGCVSPVFTQLRLQEHGLRWLYPHASVAHPLDDGPGVILHQDIQETCRQFPEDARRYQSWVRPCVNNSKWLYHDLLGPLGVPKQPLTFLRFGLRAFRSARSLAAGLRTTEARALLAGCAAHSVLPLDKFFTGAVGLVFLATGHIRPWPVARGGSQTIARALISVAKGFGVEFLPRHPVRSMLDIPPSRAVLFDLAPRQLSAIAGSELPSGFRAALERYRMGPGVFKLDWALSGSIPWKNPEFCRASTVHVGGSFDEIAAAEAQTWEGGHPERPFVMLTQQSELDATRAPEGRHTGYAYCHVPNGSSHDMTDAIERQIERFAPGFRQLILHRHVTTPKAFERHNASYLGGAVTGGSADLTQLFTRPTLRFDPYSTPNPRLFLCSQSTPPGGGVHGMCGYHAARSVLRRRFGKRVLKLGPLLAASGEGLD